MLNLCEAYGNEHNIIFSTDPNPVKSKTKCVYMCGALNVHYPACVKLYVYGHDLPYVITATHLGHKIHQLANMEHDENVKVIRFIGF